MSSYCIDVGSVQERRDGPARESLASSLGEGWELDSRKEKGEASFGKASRGA